MCYPSMASGRAWTPRSLPMAPARGDGDGTVGQTPACGGDRRCLCARELCPEGCCQPAARCWEGRREGGTVPSGRRRCGVCPWCCPWWLPGARTPDVGTAPSHLGWGFLPAFLLLPSAPSLLPSPSFPPGVSSFLPSLKPRGPPGPPPPRSSFPAGTPLTASSPGLPPRPGMMLEVVPSLACPYLC